jgi:hypothetical protein
VQLAIAPLTCLIAGIPSLTSFRKKQCSLARSSSSKCRRKSVCPFSIIPLQRPILTLIPDRISSFLCHLRLIYRSQNFYHNFQHALDVLQATHTYMRSASMVPTAQRQAPDHRPASRAHIPLTTLPHPTPNHHLITPPPAQRPTCNVDEGAGERVEGIGRAGSLSAYRPSAHSYSLGPTSDMTPQHPVPNPRRLTTNHGIAHASLPSHHHSPHQRDHQPIGQRLTVDEECERGEGRGRRKGGKEKRGSGTQRGPRYACTTLIHITTPITSSTSHPRTPGTSVRPSQHARCAPPNSHPIHLATTPSLAARPTQDANEEAEGAGASSEEAGNDDEKLRDAAEHPTHPRYCAILTPAFIYRITFHQPSIPRRNHPILSHTHPIRLHFTLRSLPQHPLSSDTYPHGYRAIRDPTGHRLFISAPGNHMGAPVNSPMSDPTSPAESIRSFMFSSKSEAAVVQDLAGAAYGASARRRKSFHQSSWTPNMASTETVFVVRPSRLGATSPCLGHSIFAPFVPPLCDLTMVM